MDRDWPLNEFCRQLILTLLFILRDPSYSPPFTRVTLLNCIQVVLYRVKSSVVLIPNVGWPTRQIPSHMQALRLRFGLHMRGLGTLVSHDFSTALLPCRTVGSSDTLNLIHEQRPRDECGVNWATVISLTSLRDI